MTPTEIIQREIERLDAEIARARTEREALLRMTRKLDRQSPEPALPFFKLRRGMNGEERQHATKLKESMRRAIVKVVSNAGSKGLRSPDILAAVLPGTEWQANSVRSCLSQLKAQGHLRLDGHWWKVENSDDAQRDFPPAA